ncbi:MAG: nuclease-related domain-containing protein [Propionicimonas sp.]|uniref:nuclease-related domain-containing protein n=1 Tax=Propionicimonas sp. TaxID=1955623 RepID=UPI003D0990C2
MKLRYAGTCARCGTPIDAGVTADYDRVSRSVTCVACPARRALPEPAEASASPRHAITPELPPHLEAVDGTAGGSAVREFDRRHDARQQRVQTAHPRIGRFLLAVFDDPQSTKAWATGAVGEQRLGDMLAGIAGPDLRVLHDRRVPRSTANIDHLVVCPSGVYVVDAKRYRDARPELRVEGGLIRPRRELLFVGGRDRTKLVDGMHKQLALVRAALADQPDVPVHGVLCFVDADWPLIGGSFTVQGVAALWMKKLRTTLTVPGALDPDRIADLQWQLHEAFPRQKESSAARA